jgi:Rrf2 family protein
VISQKTKYAIKALIYLAGQERDTPVRTADISREARVPKKFLEQILLDLKHAGMVTSTQGSKGGYLMLKDPRRITLVDIHRVFDGPIALVPCVSLNFYKPCKDCENEKTCPVNWGMAIVRDKTLSAMKRITVHSMATRKS